LTPSNGNKKDVPAFPRTQWPNEKGMTLRDYFAAKAMQGIVGALVQGIRPSDVPTMCVDSYAIADAMLEARND
jgi:hypothetical protein